MLCGCICHHLWYTVGLHLPSSMVYSGLHLPSSMVYSGLHLPSSMVYSGVASAIIYGIPWGCICHHLWYTVGLHLPSSIQWGYICHHLWYTVDCICHHLWYTVGLHLPSSIVYSGVASAIIYGTQWGCIRHHLWHTVGLHLPSSMVCIQWGCICHHLWYTVGYALVKCDCPRKKKKVIVRREAVTWYEWNELLEVSEKERVLEDNGNCICFLPLNTCSSIKSHSIK